MDVAIPNLGDIDEVEVIEICVAVGDEVAENDVLLVIESDKASMEIPAPAAGTVDAIQVSVGDQVKEGDVIVTLAAQEESAAAAAAEDADEPPAGATPTQQPAPADEEPVARVDAAEPESEPDSDSTDSGLDEATVDVLVPDLGDATGVVIIEIAVSAGDQVDVNDLLVVLESDKASMEIAAEHAGRVVNVAVEEGQEVEQGTLIATLSTTGETSAAAAPQAAVKPDDAPPAEAAAASQAAPVQQAASSSPATAATSSALPAAAPPSAAQDAAADSAEKAAARVYAGPAVRRLARELGVQLSDVKGSGHRNRITKEDVKAFVKSRMQAGPPAGTGAALAWPSVAAGDYAKFGSVELVELTRIQQRGADNLHRSWVNVPHVTQHDEADVTDLEAFRQSLKAEGEQRGVKVTPVAFLVKACCHALREYPRFNASLHEDGRQLVVKQYINIGIAVDTPQGLVVPVIKDADSKSIWELSAQVAELSAKAREKKLGLDDLQGGTFSISSLGALGGTGFTPIVNAPELAILGVAKLQTKPLWDGENFKPRKVLPLSLSYDHRVINGADGGRFMVYLTTILEDIRRLAL